METTTTTIRCPICGKPLGTSDGRQLHLGAVYCDRVVTVRCAAERCTGRVVWKPIEQTASNGRTGVLAPC